VEVGFELGRYVCNGPTLRVGLAGSSVKLEPTKHGRSGRGGLEHRASDFRRVRRRLRELYKIEIFILTLSVLRERSRRKEAERKDGTRLKGTLSSSYLSPIVAEKETEYAKTIEPIYSFLRL
jgi:hypothetical protein